MCSSEDAVAVSSMSKELKRGTALRYKKRLFGKDWREGCLVLHEDSTLVWYADADDSSPTVGVRLKDCPEMMAAGQYCSQVPGRPDFPDGHSIKEAIAIGSRTRKHVHWFICKSEQELIEWMTSISNTLPPPPGAPGGPPVPSAPPATQMPPPAQPYQPSGVQQPQGPPPYAPQPQQYPQQYPQQQPPPLRQGGGGYYGGGQAPMRGAPAGGGGTNTVIIQDRDRGDGGMGNFATGMMVGAMAGGYRPWGFGWGWGGVGIGMGGWGYGGGWGGGYRDTDVHIHNEHNTYNNITNQDNDTATTNNVDQSGADETAAAPAAPEGTSMTGQDAMAEQHIEEPQPPQHQVEDFGGGGYEDFGGMEQGYVDDGLDLDGGGGGGGGGFFEDFGGGGGGGFEDFGGGFDDGGGFDF